MKHTDTHLQKHAARLLALLPLLGAILVLSACGGGYSADEAPAGAPPPQVATAQFTEDSVVGLGVAVDGLPDSETDSAGKFSFAVGRPAQFFIGKGADRVVIGSATLTALTGAATPFSLQGLSEVQNDGDTYLGNLLSLLTALDSNGDLGDGIILDSTAQAAVATAAAGGKAINFSQSADAFAKDPVVAAMVAARGRTLIAAEQVLAQFSSFFPQGRSSTIALTRDDTTAVVVNRQKSTVSVIRVRSQDGKDVSELAGEVPVGKEPRFVALSPDDKRAYVTNAVDGTMSVIDLTNRTASVGLRAACGRRAARHRGHAQWQVRLHRQPHVGDVTVVDLSTLSVVRS